MTELIEDEDGAPLQPALQRGGEVWDILYDTMHRSGHHRFAAVDADDLAIKLSPYIKVEEDE